MDRPLAPPSGETRGPLTTTIVITFTAFALVIVILRAITRFGIIRRAGLEDYFLCVAMVASIICGVCQVFQVQYGTGKHFAEVSLADWSTSLKYLFASIIAYNFSLTLTKTAILLQYLRIFTSKGFRIAAYVMMFIVFGYATEAILTAIFNCVPVEAFWTGDPTATCIPREALWFANAGLNIFTDFSIALLPLPVIFKLKMQRRQKITLMLIFALGFFICVVSILRLTFLIRLSKSMDPTWDQPATAYWSAIEMNISIVCACLPALKPLVALVAPTLFGTSNNSQPPSYRDYRYGSNRIGGNSQGRAFSDRVRKNRSITTATEDDEMVLNDIEISGGRGGGGYTTYDDKAYYNTSLKGKQTLVQVTSETAGIMSGIKQTTVIEQNVEITNYNGRDSGSENESVRKLVPPPLSHGKSGEVLGHSHGRR